MRPKRSKRPGQVQGGRHGVPAEAGRLDAARRRPAAGPARAVRSGAQDGDVEALLELHVAGRPYSAQEVEVGGAAAQEDVLAVVDLEAVMGERPCEAAQPGPLLQQRDLRSGVRTGEGGRDPGQPAADDDDMGPAAGAPVRGTPGPQPGP